MKNNTETITRFYNYRSIYENARWELKPYGMICVVSAIAPLSRVCPSHRFPRNSFTNLYVRAVGLEPTRSDSPPLDRTPRRSPIQKRRVYLFRHARHKVKHIGSRCEISRGFPLLSANILGPSPFCFLRCLTGDVKKGNAKASHSWALRGGVFRSSRIAHRTARSTRTQAWR